jgi:hypothetical protein
VPLEIVLLSVWTAFVRVPRKTKCLGVVVPPGLIAPVLMGFEILGLMIFRLHSRGAEFAVL